MYSYRSGIYSSSSSSSSTNSSSSKSRSGIVLVVIAYSSKSSSSSSSIAVVVNFPIVRLCTLLEIFVKNSIISRQILALSFKLK